MVCLEENITQDFVEELAKVEPTPKKYILRDSAFEDNITLKDETMRRLSAYISRNTGDKSTTYTVEKDLEQGLINHLQKFLLELGRGFSFVGRQKRFLLILFFIIIF